MSDVTRYHVTVWGPGAVAAWTDDDACIESDEMVRLAIALIQATPGETKLDVEAVGLDSYVQLRPNPGGTVDITAFNRYGDPCSTAELRSDGMIALACALIRAAGKR